MAYTKPVVIAQNSAAGSFAAGCPEKGRSDNSMSSGCLTCERTK